MPLKIDEVYVIVMEDDPSWLMCQNKLFTSKKEACDYFENAEENCTVSWEPITLEEYLSAWRQMQIAYMPIG